jgi:hypothetical protein
MLYLILFIVIIYALLHAAYWLGILLAISLVALIALRIRLYNATHVAPFGAGILW